jgi:hypothetical protein
VPVEEYNLLYGCLHLRESIWSVQPVICLLASV